MRPHPDAPAGTGCRGRTGSARRAVLVALLVWLVPVPGYTQFNTEDTEAAVWTLDQAVARVESLYQGRILSAREDVGEGGVRLFVIRILTDHQEVRTLEILEGTEEPQ